MFTVYRINNYDCMWKISDAVVAAESPEKASQILEEYLKYDPNVRPEFHGRDISFKIRGKIVDSWIKADKEGVLFPFGKHKEQ